MDELLLGLFQQPEQLTDVMAASFLLSLQLALQVVTGLLQLGNQDLVGAGDGIERSGEWLCHDRTIACHRRSNGYTIRVRTIDRTNGCSIVRFD
jgi:hypothetical protein